jgi:hypothetical protein
MQYQVPQFIDVEDKIFGPLTFKQAVYIVGGCGLSYVIYRFSPSIIISAIPILIVLGISGALAFYKINNRPFIDTLESAFKYSLGSKLYLWKKVEKKADNKKAKPAGTATKPDAEQYAGVMVPRVSQSKLKDLAWNLDIQEKINAGTESRK